MRRRPDPRLPAYLVAGFGSLVAAVVLGRPDLAALGAPFLALLTVGLMPRRSAGLTGSVTLEATRILEGDRLEGLVHVEWEGEAEVDVVLSGWRGVTPVDPAPVVGWSLPAGEGPASLPFRLEATSWGVHDMGALWVRVRRPGSFVVREEKLADAPRLQVLPTGLRLSRLLKPAEPRAIAGAHVSRFRGQGTDFAEVRAYQPGDRLRDLSWATSARLGAPWVTVRHSERTGTVLLLLDAVFGADEAGTEALARTARAAWAVAQAHLRAQDRVGLLARGRTAAWLPPRGGRRARWMLLEELLTVGRAAEDPSRRRVTRGRVTVPADALVVGVTGLRSELFLPELLHYRRAGHTSVALVIDTSDLLPDARGRVHEAARRVWLAQREADREVLERGGVSTALVTPTEGVGPALLSLRRKMNARGHPGRAAVGGR